MSTLRPASALLALVSCLASPAFAAGKPAGKKPTAADAKAFVAKVNEDLMRLTVRSATAEWVKSTYITDDTERNAASLNEDLIAYATNAVKEAARFDGLKLDPDTARSLYLIKLQAGMPAPSDAKKRSELTGLMAKLEGSYGKGKWCGEPADPARCRDLLALEEVLVKSHDPKELLDAWAGWHTISRPMRPQYSRLVELANEGAKEIGFANVGDLWRSGYDMKPEAFEKETDRLWLQVKPLYDDLHCYVRSQLQKTYGTELVKDGQPIPAHLLGNMWAQTWDHIYPLVEPFKGQTSLDVDGALKAQQYDSRKMVKLGEQFYTSLGLDPLPASFWERSQLDKPRDRDVVCHASAWDVTYANDLRIKMCIRTNEEDLVTIHHELGHDYYFHYYYKLPFLYQAGANDGFHEAIGDAIARSITPDYLKKVGILQTTSADEKATLNFMMKGALEKVAFLPFGKLIDQWRWDVFSGKTPPGKYNEAWWTLRTKYQGVAAPVARSEADFDPGAKYHVAASVPYMRYFLAAILQFQFHRALCKAAGHNGPLHTCSIYGSKEAGAKLQKMLEMGQSRPWQDALEALTGQREMDATALLDYFKPLHAWLKEQNQGKKCGW
jgi:peptidyl-dipeptidase A